MTKLRNSTKLALLETIQCIVKSPDVHRYCVGLTVDPLRRRSQYKSFTPSWPHMAIIRNELSFDSALDLEGWLFDALTAKKKSIFYKKYRNDTRDDNAVPSSGGLTNNDREYFVYVAWGTKESYE